MAWTTYHTRNIRGKYLFKFVTLNNLLEFLQSGSIWFARADTFGDKMECVKVSELKKEKPDFVAIEQRKR